MEGRSQFVKQCGNVIVERRHVQLACGMEFGVSPFPETRRAMVDRGRMFGVPTYRWLPANGQIDAAYWIVLQRADDVPESLDRPASVAAGHAAVRR